MGGMAFKNTKRIDATDVIPTVKKVAEDLGIDQSLLVDSILGSAGKKKTSGDIDLNLDQSQFNPDTILAQVTALYGKDNVKQRGAMIYTSAPVVGGEDGDRVQVDFMFGIHAWQKFSYWSSEKSAYKGLYRTELLKAITAFRSDWVLFKDGIMVARVGPTFFHDRGVVWRYRHRTLNKKTGQLIKSFKETTEEKFLKIYPEAKSASHTEITCVLKFMNFLFPSLDKIAWDTSILADSYESLLNLCQTDFTADERRQIGKIYFERLNSLGVDIPLPIQTDWL